MKRLYFSLVVIALTLSSCNTIVKKFSGLTSNDLTTDSVVFHKDAEHATVHFYVDFPTDGNELLVNAVQEYINEQLGGTYTGSQTEAQPMLDYYGAEQWDSLKVEYQDMTADGDTDWMSDVSLYADKSIRKVYETEKIVTYVTQSDIYLGGAHGMQYEYGVTFRKSDGRRFGYDMMRQLYSEGFYQLTKKGLQDYFGEAGVDATRDEMLKEYGTSLTELLQIADDSGLSLVDIMEIISYFNSKTATEETRSKVKAEASELGEAACRAVRRQVNEQFVNDYYYNNLLEWLKENNVNLNDLRIGF
jgi:hypothetical protein